MAETAALQTPGAPAGRRGTPLPSLLKGGGVRAAAIARPPKIPNAIALPPPDLPLDSPRVAG